MTLWNISNTSPVLPQNLTRAEKRNVVATNQGYVRRKSYTDVHGNTRTKDEVLVAIGGLSDSAKMGTPKITDMWHGGGTVVNTYVNTWVSFSEPISQTGLAGRLRMTVANTVSGNNMVARTTTATVYDGNKLLFRWRPTVAGTYKVQAQTIANATATAANTRSTNTPNDRVNLVFSGTASNTTSTLVITAS